MLPGKKVGIKLHLGDEVGDATERVMPHGSRQRNFPETVGQDSFVDLILRKAGFLPVKQPDMPVRIPAAPANPFAVIIIVHANGIDSIFIQRQGPYFLNELGRHHLIAVQGEHPVIPGKGRGFIVQKPKTFEPGGVDFDVGELTGNVQRLVRRAGIQDDYFIKRAHGIEHFRQMPGTVFSKDGNTDHNH